MKIVTITVKVGAYYPHPSEPIITGAGRIEFGVDNIDEQQLIQEFKQWMDECGKACSDDEMPETPKTVLAVLDNESCPYGLLRAIRAVQDEEPIREEIETGFYRVHTADSYSELEFRVHTV